MTRRRGRRAWAGRRSPTRRCAIDSRGSCSPPMTLRSSRASSQAPASRFSSPARNARAPRAVACVVIRDQAPDSRGGSQPTARGARAFRAGELNRLAGAWLDALLDRSVIGGLHEPRLSIAQRLVGLRRPAQFGPRRTSHHRRHRRKWDPPPPQRAWPRSGPHVRLLARSAERGEAARARINNRTSPAAVTHPSSPTSPPTSQNLALTLSEHGGGVCTNARTFCAPARRQVGSSSLLRYR